MEAPHANVLFLAAATIVFAWILLPIYCGLTAPLSALPGTWLSRFTHRPLQYNVMTGRRSKYVHALHQKYGPVVRLSPREVSISDINNVKTMYKVGGPFIKSEWYSVFTGDDVDRSLFTISDMHQHSRLRKMVAANFAEKWVGKMEPYIKRNVKLAILRMKEEATRKGYFDAFHWFFFMATDVIGESAFGESFRMLETCEKNQYIRDLEQTGPVSIIRSEFPGVFAILKLLPLAFLKKASQDVERANSYAEASLKRYWNLYNQDPENVKPTLLTKQYDCYESGQITMGQMIRDASSYIIAGTDTTAITSTYAVWELSHQPELEKAVIKEVAGLPDDFSDEDLKVLPLLGNVIQETLRLHAPISQGLPRMVPAGGTEFGGHYIPGGTTIDAQAYTLHRNPDVWEKPESFVPSRWDECSKEMKDHFVPFGGGSRICIGMHFAQLELRHALANFYRTFDTGVSPVFKEGFSDADMEQMSFFLSPPKGKRCLVEPRVKS